MIYKSFTIFVHHDSLMTCVCILISIGRPDAFLAKIQNTWTLIAQKLILFYWLELIVICQHSIKENIIDGFVQDYGISSVLVWSYYSLTWSQWFLKMLWYQIFLGFYI